MFEGYKTYLGGAGFILTGIGSMLKNWYLGDPIGWELNMSLIFTGISIIGGRSAFKKATTQ